MSLQASQDRLDVVSATRRLLQRRLAELDVTSTTPPFASTTP
jgi:hypothetical protein